MSWTEIAEFVEVPIDFSRYASGARVVCQIWSSTGASMQARLFDVGSSSSLGESTAVTSTSPTDVQFTVSGSGTMTCRLQVGSTSAGVDLFCQSAGLVV